MFNDIILENISFKITFPFYVLEEDFNQDIKNLMYFYYKYTIEEIIKLKNIDCILVHIDNNNSGTLYSISIDSLLQRGYGKIISNYPYVKFDLNNNENIKNDSSIVIESLDKDIEIFIKDNNQLIKIINSNNYDDIFEKYLFKDIIIKGNFKYFQI